MSSNFNNAKIINVYYNKGDRKPYDVNGKPIAYIGEEFVGANEATELRFFLGEALDSGTAFIVAKRPNNDTRIDQLTFEAGANPYFKITLNAWYSEYKGKMTIIFKAYNGTVTFNEANTEITAVSGRIVVSDIFNLEVAYAPLATSTVPPYNPNPEDSWYFALSSKLDKEQSITIVGTTLPNLVDDEYDERFLMTNTGGVTRLYYINGNTPEEVLWQVGTLKLSATGGAEVTTNTGKVAFDTTYGGFKYTQIRDVVGYIGQDVEYYGKAVGTIAKGDVVQFDGVDGVHFLIKKAVPADVNANPEIILGIAKQGLTNGQFGYILHFGRITGIDLTAYADENYLWFASASANNGELTVTEPTAPNAKILMGVVVDNGASGTLLVRPLIQPSLKDLKDIHITSIANNQVLRWNNTNLRWENTSALTTAETDIANIEDGTTIVGKANADKDGNEFDATYLKKASASSTYVPLSSKGVANGVAPLDSNNKIPSIHLPGGVDDIKEFANLASFPATGEASIIYVALDTNIIYRWSGSAYVEISSSLALGETASTAFAGNRGVALETLTDDIVDGTQTLTDTRITNSAIGVSPLIINTISGTTEVIQEWKSNGTQRAYIDNDAGRFRTTAGIANRTNFNSSLIQPTDNGTIISRNVNDTNVPLIVRKQQGTGNILELQVGSSDKKLEVDVNGWFYQNGTRLFTQPGGTTNTFFGLTSGGSATTGGNNTAFGNDAFRDLTSGGNNVAVGKFAGVFQTTQSNNVLIGSNSGRTTAGNNNTFVGTDSGYSGAWGTQASASNSTGIGYQSFTDKSNQMVFGNASVSEFKFDRNASAVALLPRLTASASSIHKITRTSALTNEVRTPFTIRHLTSANMTDGFGTSLTFAVQDDANTENLLGSIQAVRANADNSGSLFFTTFNAGTESTKMTILPNGNVGIGTSSPSTVLNLVTQSNTDGIQIRRNSNTSGEYGLLSFRIATSESAVNYAEIRAIRTDRAVAQDTDLVLLTRSNSAVTERLRIRDDGLVGIGETTPTAQLQVKSGSTTRVPLIVDSLTGQTANLQEWQVNGTNVALVRNGAFRATLGIENLVSANRALVYLFDNGTIIQRNVADTNPALIVNLANASATGNIQVWQKAGVAVANITESGQLATPVVKNVLNGSNSLLELSNNGAIISRNRTDSNPALRVNQIHASSTGDLLQLEKEGVDVYAFTHDGTLKAPATFTIDPSTHGNATGKVIILGDLQVDGTTTTINSTTLEVDDKNIELSKGAANKAASDGAGISIDLGTDGEANLTYGATDDIFNLNKGLNIAGQTQISSATFPPLSVERTTTATGSVIGVSRFLATTSGDMGDGFGGSISFQIKDNANVDNTLATIVGIRSGADNSGRLSLQTNNAGTQTEKMTILPNGNVLVGTNISPNDISVFSVDKLSVVGNLTVGSGTGYIRPNTAINGPGGAIRLNASNTTTDQFLAFGINATGGSINFTERMRVTSNGNVGIGTTAPASLLSVVTSSNTSGIQIRRNSTTTNDYALLGFRISTTELADNIAEIRAVRTNRAVGSDTDLRLFTHSNNNLLETIRIRDDGLVGINETTPTAQLQVKSGATTRVPLIVDTLSTHQTGTDLLQVKKNAITRFGIDSNGGIFAQEIYNITSSSNAYVGVASTGTTISRNIADTNPALIINLANAGSTAFIQKWQKAGTDLAYVSNNGTIAATQFSNYNSGNNAVFIPSDNGSIISRNINDANVVLKVQQANASATGDLQQWIYGTNTYAYVDKDGDFYNASGSYGQISDLRVKENIVEARDYTEDLMKLRVVKYSLKKDQEQEATKLGFIAQEVEQVFPNMVQTTETDEIKDLKSIKMSVLIPMLVKTIQQLNERVKELEKK
jgi:hypothetical protein